jgi:DNA-binding NarL/FixJ family response regulator
MNAILCCGNLALLTRWRTALEADFTVYQVTALQDLRTLVGQRIAFDLLLVHHTLVDAEAIAYIRGRMPNCRLFILSDRPDEDEGLPLLRQGVVGYANSYIGPERLREAARAVATGAVWVSQQLMRQLIAGIGSAKPAGEAKQPAAGADRLRPLTVLSNREYEIARLVAQGLSNQEVADQLGITERTVKAHLGAIYAKTATRSRLALALLFNRQDRSGQA